MKNVEKKLMDRLSGKKGEEIIGEVSFIRNSELYVQPPSHVSESYRFGWLRGMALELETMFEGKWASWLKIVRKGSYEATRDVIPEIPLIPTKEERKVVEKMLMNCMESVNANGYEMHHFIEWLGYSLGIAWFKRPKISNKLWEELYRTFDISGFYAYPADYFSNFMAEHGQSGVFDYFPTPPTLTRVINEMMKEGSGTSVRSTYEPCLGAGAILLENNSINLIGADLNYKMVQVASIQAFLYQPWLLFVPEPIKGIHVCSERLQITSYFEFGTNTRIYNGNSLLGEFIAPMNIFEEDGKTTDVFINPLDARKREIFKYDVELSFPWLDLDRETREKIIKAQAKELLFEVGVMNPPFNMKMGSYDREKISEIEQSNNLFFESRKKRLAELRLSENDVIISARKNVEMKVENEKNRCAAEGQLAFQLMGQ